MIEFFNNIKKSWNDYGFETLAIGCIIIILLMCIYNILFKETGTISSANPFSKITSKTSKTSKRYNKGYDNNDNIEYIQHTEKDSKLELQAKFILEDIFKVPFYKIRPDFLRNDVTGYNLEIDLFNNDLKLGIEVQGDQHYKFTPFFHKNKETFLMQRYRDEMKKHKCKQEGIILIEIPYKVGEKGIKSYLLNQLRLHGYLL